MPFSGADVHDGYSCGKSESGSSQYVPTAEIKERLMTLGHLEPQFKMVGSGPARYYRLPSAGGTIGFISPVSEHFCAFCNRLRLTAVGCVRPCLLSDDEVDLLRLLRSGASENDIERELMRAISLKPRQHNLSDRGKGNGEKRSHPMSQVGG
jgi:cyclic pyranopterin phosphate synthase